MRWLLLLWRNLEKAGKVSPPIFFEADGSILDVSVEQVAALASQNTLPEPSLNLDLLPSSTSNVAALQFNRQNSAPRVSTVPSYSEDPWNTAKITSGLTVNTNGTGTGGSSSGPTTGLGSSSVSGTGLPKEWWKKEAKVEVNLIGQQGFILNRYTVYEVTSEVSLCFFSGFVRNGS